MASVTSAFENSSRTFPSNRNRVLFYFIQVVWNLLTADSNNNNGWIGGTDVDTEVRHPAR